MIPPKPQSQVRIILINGIRNGLLQGYPPALNLLVPSRIYTPTEDRGKRRTVRVCVKCLTQEHNTMLSLARAQPTTA